MRVLFLSWWWPYPPDNGSKIRIYNLLRHLAAKHEVILLSFAEVGEATPERIKHLNTFCAHVEAIPKPTFQPSSRKALLGYLSSWPRSLVDVYSPFMAERVQALANRTDVVIASQLQTMRYLELMPDKSGLLEEAEVTVFHDAVQNTQGKAARFRAQLTLTKLENTLRRMMKRGIALTVVSQAEHDFIRQIAPESGRIEVIPNGVDTRTHRPDPDNPPQPYTLIYNGAVTYGPNYDAVRYFIHEVLPLVRQSMPEVRFTITGSTGSVDISDLASQPGVIFSGYLASVAPSVQGSWATVVPLRLGGGTRLKVLEAMALGTPVISTRKGAEGLKLLQPGHNILLADQPQEMAAAICRVFENPDLRAQLSRNARALVEREYDWSVVARCLDDLLLELVSTTPPPQAAQMLDSTLNRG